MPTIVEVLERCPEETPQWLQAEQPTFSRREFFKGRTVYYPCSGYDGQPVKLCAKARAAHAFVYVDSGLGLCGIVERVGDTQGRFQRYEAPFLGYALETQASVPEAPFLAGDFGPPPTAWLAVLRRKDEYDEAHGPTRLALLFVRGDGVATFRALYCTKGCQTAPYLVVTQNADRLNLGRHGRLERLALHADQRPKYLLVARNTTAPWSGYEDSGAPPETGGANRQPRRLFEVSAEP